MARIMIVDDERDVVTLIKFLLERDGHAVTVAYDGAQALQRLGLEPAAEETVPDLIIMDVMMPVLDGYSVCLRLAKEPRTRKVPLVVLTAKGEMRERLKASPNVAAVLEKPFDPKKLREVVAGMLSAPGPK